MRILLIEDDIDLCRNIALALNPCGYETEACHTGTDGLFLARSQIYDAIVLDRMLPEMDADPSQVSPPAEYLHSCDSGHCPQPVGRPN